MLFELGGENFAHAGRMRMQLEEQRGSIRMKMRECAVAVIAIAEQRRLSFGGKPPGGLPEPSIGRSRGRTLPGKRRPLPFFEQKRQEPRCARRLHTLAR